MEDTLSEVAKHCAEQLRAYGECVERNPHSWDRQCSKQRQGLSLCAETHVSSLRRVKEACAEAIDAYDQCVKEHHQTPERCIDALRALHACTERAVGRPLRPSMPVSTESTDTPAASEHQ
ncbi:hypothetical protein SYNPS1DRAFT_17526 [Syncephalis pseudoplumigaleata]|uniref:IMS import disulfide relay-system CHCH-CHCH-like Cx9C domain-containing protein n=1 Tax=Syncephalis pseudoplumigaleata TaxID=1712513 RepID=A0A4P9YWG9_9FUNG|nr:hypothetical protein SYNPS1DRAFT_17526 [Syncephalis pseudoplumigaleata]|eukprot:RKP24198.1 hypothetical protein SYNPS1DRAFT_17526 [Syncephalis pseudoplumigaleata]